MQIFGRYRLLERVAIGGMAEVFLARTSSLDGFDKDLVIKRIRPELTRDEIFVSMFIDEARVSIALSHPNVVQVFDFGSVETDDGTSYYLAMEFVNGCDLGSLLDLEDENEGGLPPEIALFVMGEVCRGLDYAHNLRGRRGEPLQVIHRDISPRNILVGYDGGVKVADFGIAKAKNRISQTQPGMVLGKLVYMAPEHATGQDIDARADVFSAGAVLWELLTGLQLYGGQLTPEAMQKIRIADVERPSQLVKGIGRKLDALVMKALARYPAERFQSAREFGRAIAELLVSSHSKFSEYDMEAYLSERRFKLPQRDFAPYADESAPPQENDSQVVLLQKVKQTGASPAAADKPAGERDSEQTPAFGEIATLPDTPTPTVKDLRAADLVVASGTSFAHFDKTHDKPAHQFSWSPGFVEAVESFRGRPSIWQLVHMADVCRAENQLDAALCIYRIAALTFARHGLLAQAMLCCRGALDVHPDPATRAMVSLVPRVVNASNETMRSVLFATDGQVESLMAELLELAPVSIGRAEQPTKLLTELSAKGFSTLVEECELRHVAEGDLVVRQGDSGREMFLIANGRALVHATRPSGERVYLASLTSGDFFGENGFFSGAARAASVEALYPMQVFVITPALYHRAAADNARADATLLAFYKERVVDVVLATSNVFGLLPHDSRRAMLDRFQLRSFHRGDLVMREGETSDDIYVIKSGEARVYSGHGATMTELSTIGPGTIFGEVAALRGIPRTASIEAKTDLTTLVLSKTDFAAVVDHRPELRKKVMDVIATRVRENLDKLMVR